MKRTNEILMVCAVLVLAACDSDSNALVQQPAASGTPSAVTTTVEVLHASPDAPAVNVFVNDQEILSGVDFKTGSRSIGLQEGTYTIRVDGILPGGDVTVIGPVDLDLADGGIYTAIARDPLPGAAEFGLIVVDDFLAP